MFMGSAWHEATRAALAQNDKKPARAKAKGEKA
jgi:hypothetical protein